ncbi:MAG: CPBP family intramembrane metalloprotease [Planctomycetes bacterium]|nr:CPBP family intramembrane metalloprotease [Planctomycetota bacterium]
MNNFSQADTCCYCGAALDRKYCFCRNCGEQYKDEDTGIYGPVIPKVPSLERRVLMQAGSSVTLFCLLGVGLIGLSLLGMAIFGEKRIGVVFYIEMAFIAGTTLAFWALYRKDISFLFKRSGLDNRYFLSSLPILAVLLVLNIAYFALATKLLGVERHDFLETFKSETGFSNLEIILIISIFPAIFEETAFRGFIQQWLMRSMLPWKAIAGSALLFMLLHFNLIGVPYLFLLGLFLGWVRARTQSLYPVMILHFLHNFAVTQIEWTI